MEDYQSKCIFVTFSKLLLQLFLLASLVSFVFECGFHLKEESPFIPWSVVSCVIAQRLNRLQESMVLFG